MNELYIFFAYFTICFIYKLPANQITRKLPPKINYLVEMFGLYPTIYQTTRPGRNLTGGTCLDNFITNINKERLTAVVVPTIVSNHDPIILKSYLDVGQPKLPAGRIGLTVVKRQMSNFGDGYLQYVLSNFNWLSMYSLTNCTHMIDFFNISVIEIVDKAYPQTKCEVKLNEKKVKVKKWYTDELRHLKETCLRYYNACKLNWSLSLCNKYKDLKQLYLAKVKEAKCNFYSSLVDNSLNKPKATWNIVNSISCVNTKPRHSDTNVSLTSEGFNKSFIEKVYDVVSAIPSCNTNCLTYLQNVPRPNTSFEFQPVSVEQVYSTIMSLRNSKALDVYGLNAIILKKAAPFICEPLSHAINSCIQAGVFPNSLKYVKVVPVYKKGSKSDYGNYRPISIISVSSQVS